MDPMGVEFMDLYMWESWVSSVGVFSWFPSRMMSAALDDGSFFTKGSGPTGFMIQSLKWAHYII